MFVAVHDGYNEFVYEEPHLQYSCQSGQVRPEEQLILLAGCLVYLVLNRIETVPIIGYAIKLNIVKKVAVLSIIRWKRMRKGSLR